MVPKLEVMSPFESIVRLLDPKLNYCRWVQTGSGVTSGSEQTGACFAAQNRLGTAATDMTFFAFNKTSLKQRII